MDPADLPDSPACGPAVHGANHPGRGLIRSETLEELDEIALMSILLDPKNALTKQYRRLFDMEGVELEFREDALRAVARKAMQRRTGARGLRTILENILLDTMYDLPSLRGVQKVVVDESVIEGHSRPYIVYKAETGTDEPQRKVSGAAN